MLSGYFIFWNNAWILAGNTVGSGLPEITVTICFYSGVYFLMWVLRVSYDPSPGRKCNTDQKGMSDNYAHYDKNTIFVNNLHKNEFSITKIYINFGTMQYIDVKKFIFLIFLSFLSIKCLQIQSVMLWIGYEFGSVEPAWWCRRA